MPLLPDISEVIKPLLKIVEDIIIDDSKCSEAKDITDKVEIIVDERKLLKGK